MPLRVAALALTFWTGFAGLVYEVAWQKSLAVLLGSHAEATAVVLGIFLSGLSLGYGAFGRLSNRLVERARRHASRPRLLATYGAVEIAIGLYALAFPGLFGGAQSLSLAIPVAEAETGAGLGALAPFALDVGLTIGLIGLPAFWMGGTIPLLTQGLARSLGDASRIHALVYGVNTAGACFGALAAGFLLVPAFGLVGAIWLASAFNLVAGLSFLLLDGRAPMFAATDGVAAPGDGETEPRGEAAGVGVANALPYGIAALLCGFAMMTLQTVLVRLGAMAFGSSPFTFSMVVATFVLCIALGSLAVSSLDRIPGWAAPACLVAQVAVVCALYPALPHLPYWAHVIRSLFPSVPAAFYPYHAAILLLLIVTIGAPVLLSGAVLPLLFQTLGRRGDDLGGAAGRLYTWNTMGSLGGALLGGYALLFWLDLHAVYRVAVAALAGAALLVVLAERRRLSRPLIRAFAALMLPVLIATPAYSPWNPRLLSLGLFRLREAGPDSYRGATALLRKREEQGSVVFYTDDPVQSVAVKEFPDEDGEVVRAIVNNGKSDGSTTADYPTMALAALLPALMAERLEQAFVIGLGTGVSSSLLASLPEMKEVVVSEISPGVVEAAPFFDFATNDASRDPRIRVLRGDAYRHLRRDDRTYDIVVSEPSNPWVAGVEMLYSREFLQAARDRMRPGGVYVQWFHQYETSARSIEIVLRTFSSVFEHTAVWYGVSSDLLILGFTDPAPDPDRLLTRIESRMTRPELTVPLSLSGAGSLPRLLTQELVPLGVMPAGLPRGPLHSLLHPILTDEAGHAFFVGDTAPIPFTGWGEARETGRRNALLHRLALREGGRLSEADRLEAVRAACLRRADQCPALVSRWMSESPESPGLAELLEERAQEASPLIQRIPDTLVEDLVHLQGASDAPASGIDSLSADDIALASLQYTAYYYHAAPFDEAALRALWQKCRPIEACTPVIERMESVLAGAARPPRHTPLESLEAVPGGQAIGR